MVDYFCGYGKGLDKLRGEGCLDEHRSRRPVHARHVVPVKRGRETVDENWCREWERSKEQGAGSKEQAASSKLNRDSYQVSE